LDSAVNLLQNLNSISHHTLGALLRYLVKLERSNCHFSL